jgi:dCTP deaminase
MILSDNELHRYCQEEALVRPYRPEHVQPASIDVHLGPDILIEAPLLDAGWRTVDISQGFALDPGQFVLASTEEVVTVPDELVGDFVLRSSMARSGLNHCLAGLLDPGFRGQVTLELTNLRRAMPLRLTTGLRVGQLVFHTLTSRPARSYADIGHYCDQVGPTLPRYDVQA